MSSIKDQYSGLFNTITKIWNIYGGWKGMLCSPYFHFALFLSIALYYPMSKTGDSNWATLVIEIVPSILGFTLGGYAFLLGVGDESFLAAIRGKRNGKESPFINVNVTFVHFITLQSLSIILAVIMRAINCNLFIIQFPCILVFFYSLTTSIAAVLAIFKLAEWYDLSKNDQ